MIYDCRVGTSIWEMLNRRKSTATANGKFGISGTRISRMLDGRWVKTIVLTSPKREAALRPQGGQAGQDIGPKRFRQFGGTRRNERGTSRRSCFG